MTQDPFVEGSEWLIEQVTRMIPTMSAAHLEEGRFMADQFDASSAPKGQARETNLKIRALIVAEQARRRTHAE